MADWGVLDEKEEFELHKQRLLNVEEKPFKRITKRLLGPDSLAISRRGSQPALQTPPTPPAEGSGARADDDDDGDDDAAADTSSHDTTAAARAEQVKQQRRAAQLFKEDVSLDFAAFDSAIMRLQSLATANVRERTRYAADVSAIGRECAAVREGNAALRARLEEARATLASRRRFDELADRIAANRLLRPRQDQLANLAKLEEECAELERERESYAVTWRERREQFARIVGEGMQLRRLIRDEKDEVDRREGMHDGEDAAGAAAGKTDSALGAGATNNNNGGGPGGIGSQAATVVPTSRANTPRPGSSGSLKLRPDAAGGGGGGAVSPRSGRSDSRGRSSSRSGGGGGGSSSREEGEADDDDDDGRDVEMGDGGIAAMLSQIGSPLAVADDQDGGSMAMAATPRITVDRAEDDDVDEGEAVEEGEEEEEEEEGETMDTT